MLISNITDNSQDIVI